MTIDARLLLLAAVVLLCTGAQRHRLIDPIEWPDLDPYEPEDVRTLVTASAAVVAGDPAPFDGVCVAAGAGVGFGGCAAIGWALEGAR